MIKPIRHRALPGLHLAFSAGLALVLVACTAGAGDLGTLPPPLGSATPTTGSSGIEASATPGVPEGSGSGSEAVRVYFELGSFTGNGGLVPVLRMASRPMGLENGVIEALLAGPSAAEMYARPAIFTAIPDGTSLLAAVFEAPLETVNLSKEFTSGGVSATIVQRYAQVVFTLSQWDATTRFRFQIDGVDAPAVISSGPVDRAVTRADYLDQLPAIWVELPFWGGSLRSGARVMGMANVFEAQFRLQVIDAAGHTLTDIPVTATCGTGCWGDFTARPTYEVAGAQWGTLRVFDPSAKDGSPTNVVDYPVWLTP
ncbi:MAG TPA: Gmad2 immunoglobulin-like domain-containing protein [Candidatus Limnocylindrales bacterium]|nr:Gmad2 immunoglobulin-like domain-containing protein [Candidatus Limnocylindrales bacterium]